jgi:cation:H+ antiporter
MVIISILLFIIGIVVLAKSSSILVDGASSIAKDLKISPLLIGLTVVAFATSAPELMVSVTAALSGSTEIALGNVIGSNIFNTLVIVGVSAIIFPLAIHKRTVLKEIPFSFIATLVVFGFMASALLNQGVSFETAGTEVVGFLTRTHGIILLGIFAIFILFAILTAKKNEKEAEEVISLPLKRAVIFVIVGMIGLVLSSKYLIVDSGVLIAESFGISQTLIGLTLISVGTSLPELATSITASFKKNSDIAVGNIVGSNIFNLLLILGTTLLIRPVPIMGQNNFDITFLVLVSLVFFLFIFFHHWYKITRREGTGLLVIYLIYVVYISIR